MTWQSASIPDNTKVQMQCLPTSKFLYRGAHFLPLGFLCCLLSVQTHSVLIISPIPGVMQSHILFSMSLFVLCIAR